MKNTCILFNGGSYGTFVEWCLNYFSNLMFDESLPFTEIGNSHRFVGNQLININGCLRYVDSQYNYSFVRAHPVTQQDDDIIINLQYINNNFNKIIFLSSTVDTMAWNINNKFEKIYPHGWLKEFESAFSDNLQQWNCNGLNQMADWEEREFLSINIYEQHLSEIKFDKHQYIKDTFSKFQFVTIDLLRDNFKDTVLSLLEYCNLEVVRVNKFDYVYQEWIKLQHHCNKDQLIKTIIASIINNTYYDWADYKLTLVDEALIQYYLREQHIEIKCYNLNTFPTNTTELKEYLYNA